MGNTQTANPTRQPAVWLEGFSFDDFAPPSTKTEIAKVTAAVATIAFDMGQGAKAAQRSESAEISFSAQDSFPSDGLDPSVYAGTKAAIDASGVLQGWSIEANNLTDWAPRAVHWPDLDPADYTPVSNEAGRIADNLRAITLLRELQDTRREVTDADRTTLLKYCGWGGLARIFSPDGSSRHSLANERDALQALTSEDEFAAMRSSINTAYFTDPAIVTALWALVRQLGFRGGRVVEPTAGVGHFLAGMPADIAKNSESTAVELDTISAAMLEASFGSLGVQVHSGALEKTRLPVSFYDLVIGNVPFGDFRANDTSQAEFANWSIHNWAIGKSIDLVRPGGLVVLITSRHTLDSKTDAHRKWMSAHAELVAAYRLPTMAFKAQANTEAVTDILVLKRREMPDYAPKEWIDRGKATVSMLKPGEALTTTMAPYGTTVVRDLAINSYYVRYPENVLGLMAFESTQYGESLNPVFGGAPDELRTLLQERIQRLPMNVYSAEVTDPTKGPVSSMRRYEMENYAPPGAMLLKDGRICVSEGDAMLDIDGLYTGTARKRVLGMIEVRQNALAVVAFQARSQDDVELQRLQSMLNQTYDAFVAACGYLSTSANARLMRSDPDWPLMLALEIWDDEEGKATKADIFFKRTVGQNNVPNKVDNVKDAMLISLAVYGQIQIGDMAARMGIPAKQVVKELRAQALAFRDPVLRRWVPADEYLSGLIREKIDAAMGAGPAYASNVPALQAVLPQDLGPSEVEARLGAPWIPLDVIEQFAKELVEAKDGQISISFDAKSASWSLQCTAWRLDMVGDRVLQVAKWGTTKRCALTLLEACLNQQPPTITVTVDDRQVVDHMATLAAREKWQAIRDQFRKWVYDDAERCNRLLRIYNDAFNQMVTRKFDGSHLMLPGMTTQVMPHDHQKDAIWRIVVNGNTLLAHCVGAGKTLVMCAASMELRRLGKANKPVHIVQNSCLEQYTAEFVRLYPQARVLMASKEDLSGDRRRTWVARVATGDWDAVLMTQSTFERISLSPDLQQDFIRTTLSEARLAMDMAQDRGAKRSLKELEKRMKEMEAKIERLAAGGSKDQDNVWFNELGIDYLFYDEAHSLKNLGKLTKIPRVAGLSTTASQRAFDFYMKSRIVMQGHGDREEGIVMATATPISNSLVEMHTLQVYLQPKTLKKFGIYEFDSWSASYGETVTGIELSPDGGGYRTNTRYCRFVNLPELMAIFRGVADIRTKRMLNLPTPVIEGGKPQTFAAQPSEELLTIVAELVERAKLIRNRTVEPDEDNMLLVTNTGRNAALDVRLVNNTLPFDPFGKLAMASDNIVRIWQKSQSYLGTQLVFSDLGTPSGKGFNVYAEVKRLLVSKGVPAHEIEFVHDHDSDKAKAKLFKRVREGLVRIMIGSTSKMGTGTNVQKRLKAVHQLDAPWVPSAVEQRDGRADRQGNANESIELWRYVTERSFDSYSWNLLTVKANFIEQVMTAEAGLRTVEDISMSALTYAEIRAIATGNPLVLEKATIDADLQKLSLLRSQWQDQKWQLNHREASLVTRMDYIDSTMPTAELDAKLAERALAAHVVYVPCTSIGVKAVGTMGNGAMGLASAFRLHSHLMTGNLHDVVKLGEFGGVAVELRKKWGSAECYFIGPHSGNEVWVDRPSMNDVDRMAASMTKALADIARTPSAWREEYAEKASELATARKMLQLPFDHEERLESLLARQRQIESELSLDKDVEGSQNMAAEES